MGSSPEPMPSRERGHVQGPGGALLSVFSHNAHTRAEGILVPKYSGSVHMPRLDEKQKVGHSSFLC